MSLEAAVSGCKAVRMSMLPMALLHAVVVCRQPAICRHFLEICATLSSLVCSAVISDELLAPAQQADDCLALKN